jgi:hypothetical protein
MLSLSIKHRFEELKNSLNSMTFKVPGQEISPPDYKSLEPVPKGYSSGKKRSHSQKTEVERYSHTK